MLDRSSFMKILTVVAGLILSGCSLWPGLWPSPGYGGYAEHTEPSPRCLADSASSQFALLDKQLGCLNERLENLIVDGADLYLPASVLRAQEQSNRTFREITGRLLDDARIDLMILSAMLDDMEWQLAIKKAPVPQPEVVAEIPVPAEVIAPTPEPVVEAPPIEIAPEVVQTPVLEPEPEPAPEPAPLPEPAPIEFVSIQVVDVSGILRDINQSGVYLTGSSKPNPLLLKHLAVLAESLIRHPDINVLVVGHTDDQGDTESNIQLGLARAKNIQGALIQMGVPQDQVCVLSTGEAMPAFMNDAPESRLVNRRIEVTETSCK